MFFGQNLSVSRQFSILAGFLALVVVVVSGILISGNSTINRQATEIAETEIPVLNASHELKLAVVQVQQWLTDISATRGLDGLDDGFTEAEQNAARFRELIAKLTRLDAAHADDYQAMLLVFDAYYQVGQRMAHAYIDQGPAGGNAMMGEFDEVAATMASEVDSLLAATRKRVEATIEAQHQAVATGTTFLWASVAGVLLVICIMYFKTARALGGLPRMVQELQRVAEGDLTSSFETDRSDEIGQLAHAMSAMRRRLVEMMTRISGTTGTLSAASEQMSAITSKASSSINRQRSETEQVATAMNQMTATVQEVAGNISHTASAAQDANKETLDGKRVVEQAAAQIRNLANELEGASSTIHQLEQDSQEITTILDVIRGVAEQTNLLALNAAIEAARAGEQGRGFAVVADEVRTLASRTQQSTEEINHMIDKLRSGTHRAVEVMESSREQARSAVESATTAGRSLSSIAGAVSRINDMSTQIASAAEEQSAVSEEINRNIVRISDMTDESAGAAAQTADASHDLARIAVELENLVGQFKV